MNEKEKAAAQAEALESTARSTADRSRIWAGLNLFLAASARREKNAATRDAVPGTKTGTRTGKGAKKAEKDS